MALIDTQGGGVPREMRELLRLAGESVARDELADALLRLAQARPEVAQAYYLAWQPAAGTYAELGSTRRLPPGAGDPAGASDAELLAALAARRELDVATLRALPCWLAGRLRRAGIRDGVALALELAPGEPGLLLLVLAEGVAPGLAAWLGELLAALLGLARQQLRPAPLLQADDAPGLLLDAEGGVLDLNRAAHRLQQDCAANSTAALLPVNHRQLVQACRGQQRAVGPVAAEVGGRSLLWQFVPVDGGRVLARGRDASEQLRGEREAARARRLYRVITENTTDLISRHTPDGRFLDASPASWTLLGYWPEQLRGLRVRELLHPGDLGQMRQAREQLERLGYHTMSYRLRHRDGRYLWFETAARAIRETYTGTVVEIVSVSRDITARVQGEEARRRLAEVIEATTDLVLFIDRGGNLTYLNQSARRTLGLAEGAAAPPLAALLEPAELARLLDDGLACAEQHGVWKSDMRLHAPDGTASLPVSLVLLAHAGADGGRYFSLVARDMTERELRESQLRRHQDELAHTARLVTLGELASGIAHEINQPLAAVVNYAGASQRYLRSVGQDPQAVERVAQGLERITAHANHAAEVIRRLRAFLRKGQRRMQALDAAAVAREAVRLCAWEAAQAQVAIDEDLPDNLPPVYADRVLLEQVLLNLLRNAIEANREAHPGTPSRIRLTAGLEDGGQRLCIGVEDQGPGVGEAELEHIFTPFYTSKAEGLGLGLSMSRSIVEGFGGELGASRRAEGLRLTCSLPLAGRGEGDAGQRERQE
ncbi:PAS domain S-box protein [Pseudomonas sp. AN-1]|uniref:PAS domain-containing sensor histidine kinase n=1 Tax=Pseudomonas sp. AN-1 TaxID=3096605 RepID=UPI0039BFD1BE